MFPNNEHIFAIYILFTLNSVHAITISQQKLRLSKPDHFLKIILFSNFSKSNSQHETKSAVQ